MDTRDTSLTHETEAQNDAFTKTVSKRIMIKLVFEKLRLYRESLVKKKRELYIQNLKSRGLRLGINVHFAADVFLDPSHCFLINIGNNITFAPNVRIIAHDASTKQYLGFTRIGLVTIRDDCFIGDSVVILPGVTIGSRAIVGAGSVVSKDIPENSVAAGCPAQVLCSLEDYLSKRNLAAQERGVFGQEYWVENLTTARRKELLRVLSNGEGFIC